MPRRRRRRGRGRVAGTRSSRGRRRCRSACWRTERRSCGGLLVGLRQREEPRRGGLRGAHQPRRHAVARHRKNPCSSHAATSARAAAARAGPVADRSIARTSAGGGCAAGRAICSSSPLASTTMAGCFGQRKSRAKLGVFVRSRALHTTQPKQGWLSLIRSYEARALYLYRRGRAGEGETARAS